MEQINLQIKNRLKDKLLEISEIQEVYDKPQLTFGGYPAATITPSGIEAENHENITDKRTYKFKVDLFYPVPREEVDSVGEAIDAAYDIADRVMDKFTLDKDWGSPTSFQAGLPTGYDLIGLSPIIGEWQQDAERKLIVVSIEIKIQILIPTQACT